MAQTTIDTEASVVTLINVFTVEPARQQELVGLLNEATEQIMRHRPGFVSANIHASSDGQRVINYAQWRSEDDFKAMLADPVAQEHMQACGAIAGSDPKLYTVEATHYP